MDKHQKKIEEMLAVEEYLTAEKVFARNPLEFLDENKNRIDDRIEEVDEI